MAKGDTFFLRTTVTSSSAAYVSDNIDISAYTDPARGRVLVVDRAFITYSTEGQGPVTFDNLAGSGAVASKQMGAQACSEKQTSLQEVSDNSLFARSNLYAANTATDVLSYVNAVDALNPTHFVGGFIIPTDAIHCGIDTGSAWAVELDVGFLFEVHTEKLSLQRIQELLVSLTAN
jgi:hypothetical protein